MSSGSASGGKARANSARTGPSKGAQATPSIARPRPPLLDIAQAAGLPSSEILQQTTQNLTQTRSERGRPPFRLGRPRLEISAARSRKSSNELTSEGSSQARPGANRGEPRAASARLNCGRICTRYQEPRRMRDFYKMMLGLRIRPNLIRLTCLVWIFHTAWSRTTRCAAHPVSCRVSSPQNSLIIKFNAPFSRDLTRIVEKIYIGHQPDRARGGSLRPCKAGAHPRTRSSSRRRSSNIIAISRLGSPAFGVDYTEYALGSVHREPVVIAKLVEKPRLTL